MAVNASLKFVLREIPASREHDGMVYLALQNVPKGVPARVHLAEAPLSVACTSKLWRTALQRTQALAASGPPPLWIVEAHVGVHDGALLGVVKGIQVVAGQLPPRSRRSASARPLQESPLRLMSLGEALGRCVTRRGGGTPLATAIYGCLVSS